MGKPIQVWTTGISLWNSSQTLNNLSHPCVCPQPRTLAAGLLYNTLAFLSEQHLDGNTREKAQDSTSLLCFPGRPGAQVKGGQGTDLLGAGGEQEVTGNVLHPGNIFILLLLKGLH